MFEDVQIPIREEILQARRHESEGCGFESPTKDFFLQNSIKVHFTCHLVGSSTGPG